MQCLLDLWGSVRCQMTGEGKQEQKGCKNRKEKYRVAEVWEEEEEEARQEAIETVTLVRLSSPRRPSQGRMVNMPNAHLHAHSAGFALAASLLPARLSSLSALLPSACPRAPLVPLYRPPESPHALTVCTAVKHPLTRTGSLRLCCHGNPGAHSPSLSSPAGSVGEETACPRVCTSQRLAWFIPDQNVVAAAWLNATFQQSFFSIVVRKKQNKKKQLRNNYYQ